jgi:transposase
VQVPRRDEPSWQVVDLDALIAPDHPARLVWSFVTSLELGELYASIKGWAGRRSIRVCCWRCGSMP